MAVRTIVVWCPDWPVVSACAAAGIPPAAPVAVVWANQVVSCSAAARAEGVRRGLRRREAQSRCPDLIVLGHDPVRDARAFEPVVVAVAELVPGVEVLRPGVCAMGARGPSRYFGGDRAVAARLTEQVTAVTGMSCQVGVADGRFAAGLAARCGEVVPPGGSREFLAPFPVETLEQPELTDLLRRLGLRSLEAFAELPARDVLARFGPDGARAHRLARGLDDRPLAARPPAPELAVQVEFEPPVERVDTAAFAARSLAEELHEKLARRGLACTRLAIEAQTEHGEQLIRLWRHEGVLTAAAIADRVRWQLDGWLTHGARGAGTAGSTGAGSGASPASPRDPRGGGRITAAGPSAAGTAAAGTASGAAGSSSTAGVVGAAGSPAGVIGAGRPSGATAAAPAAVERPTAGILLLRLVPDEVIRHSGLQLGLWGGLGDAGERASRALARVQGMLGADAVLTAVLDGGRDPAERVRLVPWGDERTPSRPADQPWPGQVPAPAPATVLPEPVPAEVLAADGTPVGVTSRYAVTAAPARLVPPGRPATTLVAWAGPWPVDERWWDPAAARRRARFQLLTADGTAWLVALEGGRWWAEAIYE